MTVYWCDPYLEASVGGIHGTTSSGSGTYASPYKLSDLISAATFASGDELRFKGLTESSFFGSLTPWLTISTNSGGITSGGYDNYYDPDNTTSYGFFKTHRYDDPTVPIYIPQYASNYFRTPPNDSTWYEEYPQLDQNGFYKLDSQYTISQATLFSVSNGNFYFLDNNIANAFHGLTVTAGWTSETVQGGVTIIHVDASQANSYDMYWGGSGTGDMGRINWNCRDTLIIGYSSSRSLYIYGGDVKLKAFKGSHYQPGYQTQVHSTGDVDLGHLGGGGYQYIYNRGRSGTGYYDNSNLTRNITLLQGGNGYSTHGYYTYWNSDGQDTLNLSLKYFDGQYGWNIYDSNSGNGGTFNLTFENGWHMCKKESGFYLDPDFANGNKTYNEIIGTPYSGTKWYTQNSQIEENTGFYGLGNSPNSNESWYWASQQTNEVLVSESNTLFAKTTTATTYKSYSYAYRMNDAGATLENVVSSPLSFDSTPDYGAPYRSTALFNETDYRPVIFISPTTSGPAIATFNSPTYNDKLTWHFYQECDSYSYADTFALQIPDYSTNDLQFNASFTTSTSPGVTLSAELYYVSSGKTTKFNQSANKYGPFTPTVSGTTITFTETLSSATLMADTPVTMWCVIKADKTNSTVANLAFNGISLTQVV